MLFQTSCLRYPSKIQSGVSQCVYNDIESSCSLRPISKDPTFIILVALLTTILSLPIFVLMKYVLEGSASNWPGSRESIDDVGAEVDPPGSNPVVKKDTPSTAAEILRNSASSSAFSKELQKGLRAGDILDSYSAGVISQMAYAGTFAKSLEFLSTEVTIFLQFTPVKIKIQFFPLSHVIADSNFFYIDCLFGITTSHQ